MHIQANGIGIEVDVQGPATGEPLLLIMGLGMQLVAWPEELVRLLVGRGFRVIRFDNRDAGLSQGFDHLGAPNLFVSALRARFGARVPSAYSLDDMALDSVGVLDALGVQQAHICGASMGGMVAQVVAARHADRVKTATFMMTTSGDRRLPQATMRVQGALLSRPRSTHEGDLVEHFASFFRLVGSPAYPADPHELRERLRRSLRRAYRPTGTLRQLLAIAAHGDRSPMLAEVKAPVHVIHGIDDPLIPVAAGHDLQRKLPGSTADFIAGMGHDLPTQLLPRFAEGIARVAERG